MRRNGFTMVELIFVIIIIGILSVAAIPKFGDIKDRARVATENSAMTSLDSLIEATIEFQKDDLSNIGVAWHGIDTGAAITHANANTNKSVLGKILKKKNDSEFNVVAYLDLDENGATTTAGVLYDVIFIEGPASNSSTGIKENDFAGSFNGKPDKTDVWVFNTSPVKITISGSSVGTKVIESGELKLVDGIETLNYTDKAKIGVTYATIATPATDINVAATKIP